ncbi:MAG: hypothetical protein WDW38_005745 [Sanguina aurantia]
MARGGWCSATCGSCAPLPSSYTCKDVQPSGGSTCAQQKLWGSCQQSWLVQGGYCKQTCGVWMIYGGYCQSSCGSCPTFSNTGQGHGRPAPPSPLPYLPVQYLIDPFQLSTQPTPPNRLFNQTTAALKVASVQLQVPLENAGSWISGPILFSSVTPTLPNTTASHDARNMPPSPSPPRANTSPAADTVSPSPDPPPVASPARKVAPPPQTPSPAHTPQPPVGELPPAQHPPMPASIMPPSPTPPTPVQHPLHPAIHLPPPQNSPRPASILPPTPKQPPSPQSPPQAASKAPGPPTTQPHTHSIVPPPQVPIPPTSSIPPAVNMPLVAQNATAFQPTQQPSHGAGHTSGMPALGASATASATSSAVAAASQGLLPVHGGSNVTNPSIPPFSSRRGAGMSGDAAPSPCPVCTDLKPLTTIAADCGVVKSRGMCNESAIVTAKACMKSCDRL